jgi:hypothetical protein
VPIAVANVIMIAFLLKLVELLGLNPQSGDFIASLPQTVILLLGNLFIIGWVLNFIRNRGRAERMALEMPALEEHEHEALHAGAPGH